MANKKNPHRLTATDIALAVLAALGGAIAFMTIALVAGSLLFPESWERPTVEAPSAQPSYHGTLPSKAPTSTPTPSPTEPPGEPSSESAPEQTVDPVPQTPNPAAPPSQAPQTQPPQTQAPVQTRAPAPTPAPTRAPTVPVQTPAPVVTVPPVQNTPAPTQAGNAGTTQNGDGTYTHDFSGGRVLATRESNNNNDPVYHTKDCRSAKRIPPENELWYSSAQAAQNDGRRLCGICGN